MLNYRNYGRLWRVYGRCILRYGTPRKIVNAVRTEVAYRRRQTDVTSRPYLIFIEPLYYCNLKCPLCQRQAFGDARKNDAGKLPLALYDKILDELGDYLFQCHIFGLGEPLLDWPLTKQIIQKAHTKRIFTLVSTNCTILNPDMARDIIGSGLDHLVCAVDGISQESYGKYRVGGQVDKALANMRRLCEERDRQRSPIQLEWQYLVNAFSIHEMDAARKLADEMNIVLRFAPMGGMEWDPQLQEYWLPKTSEWQDARLEPGKTRNPWHCYWLWRSLVVNSNGQLARCPGYQNVAQMGKVGEQTIMSLYNGPASQRARQLFHKGPVEAGDFPAPCATCAFYEREHGSPNPTAPGRAQQNEGLITLTQRS